MARSPRGAILIVVLFVMVVVSMIALSLAYRSALVSRVARNETLRAQLNAQVRSAVALVMASLAEDQNAFDHPSEAWAHQPSAAMADRIPEWRMSDDGRPAEFAVHCAVVDEEGKLNLQYASSQSLETLGLSRVQIDSLFDWTDPDDIARAEGAEQSYYDHLPTPYRCKNTAIESLDELPLIRGFGTAEFLGRASDPSAFIGESREGTDMAADRQGMVDYLTVWGDGRINLNTASSAVLATLPITDAAVSQIISYRTFDPEGAGTIEDHVFQSADDIERLQGLLASDRDVLAGVAAFQSQFYRVVVTCTHRRTGVAMRLGAYVQKGEDGTVRVLQWRSEPIL